MPIVLVTQFSGYFHVNSAKKIGEDCAVLTDLLNASVIIVEWQFGSIIFVFLFRQGHIVCIIWVVF